MTTILPVRRFLPFSLDSRSDKDAAVIKIVADTFRAGDEQHARLLGLRVPEGTPLMARRVSKTTHWLQAEQQAAEGIDRSRTFALMRPYIPNRNIFGTNDFPECPWDERDPVKQGQLSALYATGPRCYNWQVQPFGELPDQSRRFAWYAGAGSGPWVPFQIWNQTAGVGESWSEGTCGDGRLSTIVNGKAPINPDTGVPVYDFTREYWLLRGLLDDMIHEIFGHNAGINAHANWYESKGETIGQIGSMVGWGPLEMLNHNGDMPLSRPWSFYNPNTGQLTPAPAGMTPRQIAIAWGVSSWSTFIHYPSVSAGEGDKLNAQAFRDYPTPPGDDVQYPYSYGLDIQSLHARDQLTFRQRMGTGDGPYSFVVPATAPPPEPPPTPTPPPEPPANCPLALSWSATPSGPRMALPENGAYLTIKRDQTIYLHADSCGVSKNELAAWRSSRPERATVSETADASPDGVVRGGAKAGETYITATLAEVKRTVIVKVQPKYWRF